MRRTIAIITALFAFSLALITVASPASAQTGPDSIALCDESWTCSEWSGCSSGVSSRVCTDSNNCGTELNKPPENQGCATATGIVKLTILRPPQICGDGICSKNEAWTSCPADCVLSPAQSFVGIMTGGISTSASGVVLATGMAAFLFAMGFRTVPKKKDA